MREYFGDIERVWLVILPIAVALIYFFGERAKSKIAKLFVDARLLPTMLVWKSGERRFWKHALRVTAVLCIGLALMRPQWGKREVDVVRKGIDIVFAVDVSKSMWAEDVQPNRLERVKQDIRYFANQVVEQDRISLVGFAGTARVLCPLTADRGAFDVFLDELDVGTITMGGTDLEAALQEALHAFGDDERNHKAVILFSDGETHQEVSEDVLSEMRKKGIRVYTVGIGSSEGVRIPVKGKDGKATFMKDENGDIVMTRLDDRTLKTIAQKSLDGAYTNLAAGRENLARIYRDNIKKIEERELSSARRIRKYERFQWFLAAAFLCLLLQALIADGKKTVLVPEAAK